MTAPTKHRELGFRDLTLFAVTCVVSSRWIPLAAQAGAGSITLWILAAVFFAGPLSVAVSALVARDPRAGGLYAWTRADFGPWHGFFCAWIYWIGIACLFPTAAMMFARVAFSLLPPAQAALGENRIALLAATLLLLWIGLGANLLGLKVGKWAENAGAAAMVVITAILAVVAGLVWARRGSATPLNIVPTWNWGTVSFWAAIAYGTSGMEGPAMMAAEVRDPERTMRRAGWLATGLAAGIYVTATAAFLVILPPEQISELNGFASVGNSAGALLGLGWLSPLIAVLVLISGVGLIGGIGTATSQLPFAAAKDGLLPAVFARSHPKWDTPHASILSLGLISSGLLVLYQLGDSARAAYDGLVSLMVITGFLPYLYVFGSAWKTGKRLAAISGGAVTVLAVICAVVPPSGITNVWLFEIKLVVGTLVVMATAWLAYRARRQ